jgi:polysaccharide biosynthesis/export protein
MGISKKRLAFSIPLLAAALYAQQDPGALPAGVQQNGSPSSQSAEGSVAPVDPNTYTIGPEDVLLVRVWREPEHSGSVAVRPDGKISLPLIGELQAGGLTPAALTTQITEALSKFLKRPEVLISVQQVNSKKYYISGEVGRPGSFALAVPTTVLQALTQAGGFRDFANTKKIIIMRGSERLKFNYKDVIKGKNMEQNILLYPDDHIVVP